MSCSSNFLMCFIAVIVKNAVIVVTGKEDDLFLNLGQHIIYPI